MGGQMVPADPPAAQPVDIVAGALTVSQLESRLDLVQEAMKRVMKVDEDFGIIPGTPKPTLLQPGAQKLTTLFQLDPQYEITTEYDGQHYTVTSRCILYDIQTGRRVGSGMGLCTTKETRYAFRNAKRTCPTCHKETIIKGKAEYGGGWLCWKKDGRSDGCGAKFKDDDQSISSQEAGKVANENPADQYNTAVKMGNKRSLIAAVLVVTAASAIFTQDLEDMVDQPGQPNGVGEPRPAASSVQPPQRRSQGATAAGGGLIKMTAKHAGKCASCNEPIVSGQTIHYDRVAKLATCDPCNALQG